MTLALLEAVNRLRDRGWKVKIDPAPMPLASVLIQRYPWVPLEVRELISEIKFAVGPHDQSWLLTNSEFSGDTDTAFKWNEWETMSLEAAQGNEALAASIKAYWDDHLPILMSLRSGYAYFALEKSKLKVVGGWEPNFEESIVMAESLSDLLTMLADQDSRVSPWI